jgi:hypothetical protein
MGNGQKTLHKIRELAEVARRILRGTLRVIRHLVCLSVQAILVCPKAGPNATVDSASLHPD